MRHCSVCIGETALAKIRRTARATGARPSRAFTLVEMLVVMAIIGLLAAMLLPALARSKDHARLAQCRNRLRNLGVALRLYADEREGALPVSTCVDGPHTELTEALEGHYIEDIRSFYCPAETHPLRCFSRENFAAGRIGYFYYSCEKASKNRDVSGFLRIDVRWPRLLRATMPGETWVLSDGWFRGEATPHRHYQKGMNYLTLSGVVGFLERSPRSSFK